MAKGERLPTRRHHEGNRLEFEGAVFHVGLGRIPGDTRILEAFIRPRGKRGKGSDMERLCDDVAVMISWLLRSGVTPRELADGLGRQGGYPTIEPPVDDDADHKAPPASFAGAVAELIATRQQQLDKYGEELL